MADAWADGRKAFGVVVVAVVARMKKAWWEEAGLEAWKRGEREEVEDGSDERDEL